MRRVTSIKGDMYWGKFFFQYGQIIILLRDILGMTIDALSSEMLLFSGRLKNSHKPMQAAIGITKKVEWEKNI